MRSCLVDHLKERTTAGSAEYACTWPALCLVCAPLRYLSPVFGYGQTGQMDWIGEIGLIGLIDDD